MATPTPNYAMQVDHVNDDIVTPTEFDKVRRIVDNVLGEFLQNLFADGVISGWTIAATGTIDAGSGMIDGAYCRTTAVETTLAEGLDASETDITVTDGSAYYADVVFRIDSELFHVTDVNGNTLTVERGYRGTTATTHSNGATLSYVGHHISNISPGAKNYIYGHKIDSSATYGRPSFRANTTGTKASGDIYLGYGAADANGNLSDIVCSSLDGYADRNCYPFEILMISGTGEVAPIPAGTYVDITIDHSAIQSFKLFGKIEVTVNEPDFSVEYPYYPTETSFKVRITNNGSYSGNVTYSWVRRGNI